jgi:hypothetical protein
MTTPAPEKEQQTYDLALGGRDAARIESQRLQKAQEAVFARKEHEALSLRGSPEQERLEDVDPIEVSVEVAPIEQRSFGTTEMGLVAGVGLILLGGLFFSVKATQNYQQHKKDRQNYRKANNVLGSEALNQISQILDNRVAAENRPRWTENDPRRLEAMEELTVADQTPHWKHLGEIVIDSGVMTREEVSHALKVAQSVHVPLGQYLVQSGKISSSVLCKMLALQSGLPIVDLTQVEVPLNLAALFGREKMSRHEFIPFKDARSIVCVAAARPLTARFISDLESLCKKKVEVYLAEESKLMQLIDNAHRLKQPRLAVEGKC